MYTLPTDILTDRIVLDSRNFDEVRNEVGHMFVDHDMHLSDDNATLRAILKRASLPSLSLSVVEYGCKVSISPNLLGNFYLLHINIGGQCDVSDQSHQIVSNQTCAAFLSPVKCYEFQWYHDSRALAIQIPKSRLHAHARAVLGLDLDEDLEFDMSIDLNTFEGEALLRLVRFLVQDAELGYGVTSRKTTAKFLEGAFIDALLSIQLPRYLEHGDPVIRANSAKILPYHVRRARQHMANNTDRSVRVSELADVAGVTSRTLSTNFNQFLGVSPARYFLNMRLDRARSMLESPSDSMRVSDVAHEFGFDHQSRFSAAYKERFDELPSETLWRCRN